MSTKYVVLDLHVSGPTMFIFPDTVSHQEVASRWPNSEVLSAGEIGITNHEPVTTYCFGKSVSLKVESNPEVDNRLAAKLLRLGDE